ncbi:MAG: class I SAM-dependent methyltransferase [Ignavibacteriales bacterium]|nr:class I SAM-dependent methyltransferase [Ignavibacteriales bacterium]
MTTQKQYHRLIEREAQYWGSVSPNPRNPQIWDDEKLFEIFFRKEYEALVDRASSAGSPILELGCGEGNLALTLAQRGCSVEGIDLSSDRIERARQKAVDASMTHLLSYSVGDLNTIGLLENRYRCVVAHDTLHHVLNLDHLLSEVRKSLMPGASFLAMDFAGMSQTRRLFAAVLYAIVPTIQPYAKKWKLRKRLGSFLASEKKKRVMLEAGLTSCLHPDSPFEEISQSSLIPAIRRHFEIVHCRRRLPFWYYLAPKLRLPSGIRYQAAQFLKLSDDFLSAIGVQGAYFFLEGQKP